MSRAGVASNSVILEARKTELIKLLLDGNMVETAAMLIGISRGTAFNWLRSPELRAQIRALNSELASKLDAELVQRFRDKAEIVDDLAMIALDEMKNMLQDRNLHPSVRAKLIDSALDRHPEVSRTKKLDITSRTLTLKGEDLLVAAQVAKEMEESRLAKEQEEAQTVSNEDPNSQQNLIRD